MIQLAKYFRYLCASYVFLREMEKPADVLYGESNGTYRVMEVSIKPDLPPTIESKILTVSCDNTRWPTGVCTQGASATSCKIFQTLYLCLTA